jgi:DNA-directed RNA polymerase specialized sigma24 family protein
VAERVDERATIRTSEKGFTVNGQKNKQFSKLPDYLPWMIRKARRWVAEADAEDVALLALHSAYRPTRPPPAVNDSKRMKPWLAELVRFAAFSIWHDKKKHSHETLWDEPNDVAKVPMQLDLEANIETRECLQVALDSLSERDRSLIWRHEVEEVPLSVLADEHGVGVRTVQIWLKEAREELRRKFLALQTSSRSRMFVPVWFRLSWSDESIEHECWFQRLSRRFFQMVRHSWPWAASGALVLVCVGFVPRSWGEPSAMTIAAEPIRSADVVRPIELTAIAPGTKAAELVGPTASTAVVPNAVALQMPSKVEATNQASASDEDDSLLLYAKAAFNQGNAKRALNNVTEHERRFPNSSNARQREQLRETIKAIVAEKR